MSSNRTERLLNLVICLLSTSQWLSKERIRQAVPQYAGCGSDLAFDRMFERDKEDLRELGIPVRTGSHPSWFDDEQGYRIDREAYALPPIELTTEEATVLGLASRVWQQASLAGPAARAMVKLEAMGVSVDESSLVGVEPRVRATEPTFDDLYAATRDRAPVTFSYRKPDGQVDERQVEPWVLTSRGGWWYLVGHDRVRAASRAFRLSRIEGGIRRAGPAGSIVVPADIDASAVLPPVGGEGDRRTARLRVRQGRGAALRQRATAVTVAEPGWDLVELAVGDRRRLSEELAGHGPTVVVLDPADLRGAVVGLLTGSLQAHSSPPDPSNTHGEAVTS
jgi:proteasome accessory factor B